MDEKKILNGIISGEQQAFSAFFHFHWKTFFSYANKILNDTEESTDILQDTFASIWENRSKLHHVQSLTAYTYTIIHHKAVKCIKDQVKFRHLQQELGDQLAKQSDKPLQEINAKELAAIIQHKIEQLPPRMREVFELSRTEQLSYKEIAQQLNISELTVKKQINLSLRQIKRGLQYAYFTKSLSAVSLYKALLMIANG